MTETGIVVRLEGGLAEISFTRTSACAKCGRCGLISGESSEARLLLPAPEGISSGDRVWVELPESSVVKASLIAYGIPFAAFMAGLALGPALFARFGFQGSGDLAAGACALLCTALAFAALRIGNARIGERGRYTPRITAFAAPEDVRHPPTP